MIYPDKVFDQAKQTHIARLRYDIKRRATARGIVFEVDTKYLSAIAPNICPIFNVPLKWGYGGNGSPADDSPSLDRIIPERGYVRGNVAWICNRANTIKSTATEKELYAVADWLHKKRKEVENGGAHPPHFHDPAFTYIARPAYTKVDNSEAARERGGY